MKIYAVARNDGGSRQPVFGAGEGPVWYEIPDSALLRTRQPFFIPDFAGEFRLMPTLVYRVSRLGKGIGERFAGRYIDAVAAGCAAVGADLLCELRSAGEPWCRAVAFDKCCMLGQFRPLADATENVAYRFTCGGEKLTCSADAMRLPIGSLIAEISRDNTLKNGDIVLAALHPTGFLARIGDRLEAFEISTVNNDNKDNNEPTADGFDNHVDSSASRPVLEINIR